MYRYNQKDLSFYYDKIEGGRPVIIDGKQVEIEGDLEISETGDLLITRDFDSSKQDIMNRIRTQTMDWRSHPRIGGNLELLEGEKNTRITAAKGLAQIKQTLFYDGRFIPSDVEIKPVPSSVNQLDYYVFLNAEKEKLVIKESVIL
jgi:hypothetical protein